MKVERKTPQDMSFLIVDDMDTMRRSVRAMLKLINYGNRLYEAPNGREAWDMLERGKVKVDFVICDYNMPFLTGTELLYKMRNNKKLRDIPFLMITADANKEVVAEAAEQDVDAYLTKPFVTASLEAKIDELLGKLYNPDEASSLLRASRDADEAGELQQAIKLAIEASKKNPRLSRPYRELGRLFLKKKNYGKAMVAFTKAVEMNRLDVSSYHFLGQLHFRAGDYSKAINYYSKAMEISPRQSERAFKFVNLLLKKDQYVEAEKVLKLILKYHFSDLDKLEKIATVAAKHGFYELAVKCYRKILKYVPDKVAIRKRLGITLFKKGQLNEATQQLEMAVKKFSQDVPLLLTLSKAYLDMEMFIRADKWAVAALRIDPENREAKKLLAKCT